MYKGKKVITIEHPKVDGIAKFEFDFSNPKTIPNIKEMVDYHEAWQQTLKNENGDYIMTFCKEVAIMAMVSRLAGFHIIRIQNYFQNQNGFMAIDGSNGFRLVRIEANLDIAESSNTSLLMHV